MAAVYGLAYAIGVGVAWRRLRKRLGGDLDGANVLRTYARLGIAALPAALLSGGAAYAVTQGLGQGVLGSLAALLAGGVVLLGRLLRRREAMRIAELNSHGRHGPRPSRSLRCGGRAQPSPTTACRA